MATTINSDTNVTGDLTWSGSLGSLSVPLTVTGAGQIEGKLTVSAGQPTTVNTLQALGASNTFDSTFTVSGASSIGSLTGPSAVDTTLGALAVTGNLTLASPQTLEVTGAASFTGNVHLHGATSFKAVNATNFGGTFGSATLTGRLTASGTITIGTSTRAGSLELTTYPLYVEGWGNNGSKQVWVTYEGRLFIDV